MRRPTKFASQLTLVNGSAGDPVLYVDYPGRDDALLFDAGDLARLGRRRLADLQAVFLTHHHIDHFMGFDRLIRANLDSEKRVTIHGPAGTIQKVYDRIKSYELPFFPFQKVAFEVVEIEAGKLRRGLLECTRRFPEPKVEETAWNGGPIYRTPMLSVECTPVDHTVPCLAYAVVEVAGFHPDLERIAAGVLRPGGWISAVQARLQAGADLNEEIAVEGGKLKFRLGDLAESCFQKTPGARIAFVTDTAWSDAVRTPLLALAHRAARLYCDCFYAQAQEKQAAKHRHMTTRAVGEFARVAGVEELVLMHFAERYRGRYELLADEVRAIFPSARFEAPDPGEMD